MKPIHLDRMHWEMMLHAPDAHQKRQMIEALRAYCRLDTLAMVEIHRVLRDV